MFPATATRIAPWQRRFADGAVTFTRLGDDRERAPRVWSGHGLGMPAEDLPGFLEALAKVMKRRPYWVARTAADPRAGDAHVWSAARFDDEDGFVYLGGPCLLGEPGPGYRPAPAFTVALPHVRGLRIRVAAYLARP